MVQSRLALPTATTTIVVTISPRMLPVASSQSPNAAFAAEVVGLCDVFEFETATYDGNEASSSIVTLSNDCLVLFSCFVYSYVLFRISVVFCLVCYVSFTLFFSGLAFVFDKKSTVLYSIYCSL